MRLILCVSVTQGKKYEPLARWGLQPVALYDGVQCFNAKMKLIFDYNSYRLTTESRINWPCLTC